MIIGNSERFKNVTIDIITIIEASRIKVKE